MASVQQSNNERYRAPLERMLTALDDGDDKRFNRDLESLTELREQSLFREIGKLTRELHDALNAFRIDRQIEALIEREMPGARASLAGVIETTEKAAHRSLGLIEGSMGECEALRRRVGAIRARLDSSEALSAIGDFLAFSEVTAERWHDSLSDLLVAQDYQDLTGQVIRKVIALVERVEEALVDLVRLSGDSSSPSPPVETHERLEGQDDVDRLLSGLGF
jgi:chemotaxis protein CheZ